MDITATVRARLLPLADEAYKAFLAPLIPTVPPERFVGVRTPQLRNLARELEREGLAEAYLESPLPHATFDEMQLHAFLICRLRNMDAALRATERFLPHVDNWATCDQLAPRIFARHRAALLPAIARWLADAHEYTVRFGIGMLMLHFLDAPHFHLEHLEAVAAIDREEYYVRMMQAWYFATALAKQYDAALPYIVSRRLNPWTHRRAIQKAVESRRITPEQKVYLRTLR
ncbi:MAG: DNA alkylation repair protein [Bacteroidaceae bacterium]|nr:DNA alkylation repair protein [Bacteroidaceae bacterium]